ncbi:hypothetical protein N836_00155 [Leptolyngbya sp. Heron Island J]|uniref:hypothetical protein n=1 Tax=Leptolyngbya sp. Heron Island J TaxID=1385935 RepID=UPI0003B99470|nr:hypothetical protein [Leptolyngbya sp. Heron Island J]ESA37126.1 hypothetical protein N836_00155 [Leptolyngbya sp. Heron Island J]
MRIKELICNLTNLVVPGVGTILAGGLISGFVQFVLFIVCLVLVVMSFGWLLVIAVPLYVIDVIWCVVSVYRLTRSNQRRRAMR